MRRAVAHTLLMIFSWMLIAPLFAWDADAGLPACCRRNGKHHCTMSRMGQAGGNEKGFTSVSEKCPCLPAITCAVHAAKYMPVAGQRFYAEVTFHPVYAPQTSARFGISFLRGHQKRGPPSLLV
jgi:hypothetical protein